MIKKRLLLFTLIAVLATSAQGFGNTRKPYRTENFNTCCNLGKAVSNSSAPNACYNYNSLTDRSGGCQFAFTICCSQQRRLAFKDKVFK